MIFLLGMLALQACSPKNISTNYYEENKNVLDKIERSYSKYYKQSPFTVAFTDKAFETISLEIITDTLTYIYSFKLHESRIADSLKKYKLNVAGVTDIIAMMKNIRCTWVNNFNYYVDGEKKSLVFMSIKPVGLSGYFSKNKYYILPYFSQDQYFDKEGRLVNNRKQRQLQKVNGEIFKRINAKVSYTVSSRFR